MGAEDRERRLWLEVGLLCVCWYAESSTSNVLNKRLLSTFPFPLTVAMSSLFFTATLSVPLLRVWGVPNRRLTAGTMGRFLLPLGVGKIVALAASFASIWKVPVSYAHTIKATMPLFAILFARLILKERQTKRVYLSLAPIVLGVGIASVTELSFNLLGLFFALTSTATYAVLNVGVKRVLRDTGLHHLHLLGMVAQVAGALLLPVWCLHDLYPIWKESLRETPPAYFHPSTLVFVTFSGLLNFGQNLVTFTLIHKLTALSYAVANAAKRIIVIGVSIALLKNPVTPMNLFGMSLSVLGVFIYNRAKQTSKPASLGQSFSTATLSDATLFQRYTAPGEGRLLEVKVERSFQTTPPARSNSGLFFEANRPTMRRSVSPPTPNQPVRMGGRAYDDV